MEGEMGTFIKKITTARYYARLFRARARQLDALDTLLADQTSREVLADILRAYRAVLRPAEFYLTRAARAECSQYHFTTLEGRQVRGTANPYFLDELFSLTPDMVLLDGGAYIGDTIQQLFRVLGGPCRYVYAFEPNQETYPKLLRTAGKFRPNIQCFPWGLDDHDGTEPFSCADAGSRIAEGGDRTVRVADAGKFLMGLTENRPTFIKLDIEGREPQVLESMAPYLQTYTPDLAVSIYHKLEDLWEIPLRLHAICPAYKIYIRHQSNYFTETVCYATAGGAKC